MFACACANPACAILGCAQARRIRSDALRGAQIGGPTPDRFPRPALTPEDIRRIVREEIERSKSA